MKKYPLFLLFWLVSLASIAQSKKILIVSTNVDSVGSYLMEIAYPFHYFTTAGHGVASLIHVQLANGKFLVAGKRITCFPHWAELKFMKISNYGKLLPFDMEEVLARRGANLVVCTPETRPDPAYTHLVDKSHRIVTGAFATSAQWVAEEMVKLLN